MEAGGVLPLLDVDGAVLERDRLDLAELGAAEIAQILAAANLGFLRRKAVAMDRRLGGAAGSADKDEPGQSGALIEQVLGGEIGQPEILPPHRLFFPAVPVENVCQYPARLLLLVPLFRIGRNVSRQPFDQRVDLDQPVGDLFVRRAVAGLRAGHVRRRQRPAAPRSASSQSRKASGGTAIILVVGAHRRLGLFGDRRDVVEFEIRLEIGERDIRIGSGVSRSNP